MLGERDGLTRATGVAKLPMIAYVMFDGLSDGHKVLFDKKSTSSSTSTSFF
jgi:hypothetical protein